MSKDATQQLLAVRICPVCQKPIERGKVLFCGYCFDYLPRQEQQSLGAMTRNRHDITEKMARCVRLIQSKMMPMERCVEINAMVAEIDSEEDDISTERLIQMTCDRWNLTHPGQKPIDNSDVAEALYRTP